MKALKSETAKELLENEEFLAKHKKWIELCKPKDYLIRLNSDNKVIKLNVVTKAH